MSKRKYASRTTSDLVRSQAKKFPCGSRLSKSEEDELIARWQQSGDRAARDKVAWANMGTVYACALTAYAVGGSDIEDLVGESCLGFMHAFDKYDPTNGARFSSYAYNWCKAHVMAWFDRTRNVTCRGRTVRSRRYVAMKTYGKVMSMTGSKEMALRAAGEAIEISDEKEVAEILHSRDSDERYDSTFIVSAGGGETWESDATSTKLAHLWNPDTGLVHGGSMPPAQDDALDAAKRSAAIKRIVDGAMDCLNENQRRLIELAYLSDEDGGHKGYTFLTEAGRMMKKGTREVSRQRLAQIKERAFDKIYKHVVEHGGLGDLLAA